jgi:hypothetical protein
MLKVLQDSDYTTMLNLLANQDEYQFNLITAPGLNKSDHSSEVVTLINNAQSRGDNIAVVDMDGYGTPLATITSTAAGIDSHMQQLTGLGYRLQILIPEIMFGYQLLQ